MGEDNTQDTVEQEPEIVGPQLPPSLLPVKKKWGKFATSKELKGAKHHAKKLKMLELHASGMNLSQIGRVMGSHPQTVKRAIERFNKVLRHLPNVKEFRQNKSDILTAAQMQFLESALSPDKLKRASSLDSVKGFDILNKADRIENNLSTENVSHLLKVKLE